MLLEDKKTITRELAERIRESDIIYLTDFTGLDVKSITELRDRLSEKGLQYRVVKNTLMIRALEGLDLPDITDHLTGPTGLVLGSKDPVMPAKVVKEFAKEHDQHPVVKIGIVDRRMISPEEVAVLASLPPHDQILASIAGSLTAAAAGIVGVLEGLIRDIAYMTEEVARKQESGSK